MSSFKGTHVITGTAGSTKAHGVLTNYFDIGAVVRVADGSPLNDDDTTRYETATLRQYVANSNVTAITTTVQEGGRW